MKDLICVQTTFAALITLQFALAILWCQLSTPKTRATVPTAIVSFIASVLSSYLSHLEHIRSVRPSTILCLFLSLTLLLDLPRLRSLSFLPGNETVTTLFAGSLMVKTIAFALESIEKRSLLRKGFENSSIETTSGVINRSLFWWLNSVLRSGSQTTLTVDTLPALDEELNEATIAQSLTEKWIAGMMGRIHSVYFLTGQLMHAQPINTDRTHCFGR